MKNEVAKATGSELTISTITDLQTNYKQIAESHLSQRFADNPEFQKEFLKNVLRSCFLAG